MRMVFLPSLFWSLACFIAAFLALIFGRGWAWFPQSFYVGAIYGAGALLSVWPTLILADKFAQNTSLKRFVVVLILLAGFTAALTALIFALQFRHYFAQWHGEPFSRLWLWQQAFTGGVAVYTYLVLGLRLYIPTAIIALFVTSWWLNRSPD